MAPTLQIRMAHPKILVRDLNPFITCSLCRGYFVDATTLIDCLHVFCRACILRYFDNFKPACPTCNLVYKRKSNPCFRSDSIIQSLVYKVVPGLYSKEVQRREDFYRSTGVRASSSCSEDSVLGDLSEEHEEWVLSTGGDQNQYLSPDDAISLSLEYYQPHLDTTHAQPPATKSTNSEDYSETNSSEQPSDLTDSANPSAEKTQTCDKTSNTSASAGGAVGDHPAKAAEGPKDGPAAGEDDPLGRKGGDRRYLQCPAAVTMSLLQKFLRMKYALSAEHRVDIIHSGEVLPPYFNLMDVAYTFKWQRTKPMRFFYRIFTPAKIQPIKIISTPSSSGKQLQVVPAKPVVVVAPPPPPPPEPPKPEPTKESPSKADCDAQNYRNKERLMANLQLQSKAKMAPEKKATPEKLSPEKSPSAKLTKDKPPDGSPVKRPEDEVDCIYEYEEPDKEEIRAFAEKRDREWALQKQLDEEKERHRNSKKRKKSKHSKGNLLYKKRKLHAEITSSEEKDESLKLKVKLTTPHNGYKHKHHKSSQSQTVEAPPKQPELSSKEKLLQMRQVRHKHISTEDKTKTLYSQTNNTSSTAPLSASTTSTNNVNEEIAEKPVVKQKEEQKPFESPKPEKPVEKQSKPSEPVASSPPPPPPPAIKKPQEPSTPTVSNKATQSSSLPNKSLDNPKITIKEPAIPSGKTLRSDFANKTNATKELCMQKYPTVQLERNEQTERQAQKTFLKTFQSYTEKLTQNSEKVAHAAKTRPVPQNTYLGRNHQAAVKSLEQKIANLHQQCTTIEAKSAVRPELPKVDKKPSVTNDKPHILNSQYSSGGFTVSKVEAGVKRKLECDDNNEKRPSLEITLISPTPVEKPPTSISEVKHVAKRPPPATIPLERIKKSVNRISGISIIPKLSDRCDNTGALDLSKPSKSLEITPKPPDIHNKVLNGLSLLSGRPPERVRTPDKNIQLSNLQMLSKVALEHPNINKNAALVVNKRPQMPNLQTLKIPVPQNSGLKSNLAKLPKLNEINKMQFRMPNPQLRNMRPNQNQSIRNIPNPSLLVRQQNQNRLNSLNCSQSGSSESKEQLAKPGPVLEVSSSPKGDNKDKTVKEEKDHNKMGGEKKVSS